MYRNGIGTKAAKFECLLFEILFLIIFSVRHAKTAFRYARESIFSEVPRMQMKSSNELNP